MPISYVRQECVRSCTTSKPLFLFLFLFFSRGRAVNLSSVSAHLTIQGNKNYTYIHRVGTRPRQRWGGCMYTPAAALPAPRTQKARFIHAVSFKSRCCTHVLPYSRAIKCARAPQGRSQPCDVICAAAYLHPLQMRR